MFAQPNYASDKMYLKKVDGPRAVTLPDGTVLTQADLPERNTKRWVASRKAALVRGVLYGLITQEGAQERYGSAKRSFKNGCEPSPRTAKTR